MRFCKFLDGNLTGHLRVGNGPYRGECLEVKNKENNSLVTIRNTMRRIIEYYFKILGKLDYDQLLKKFPNSEEKELCRSLLSWINEGSHSIQEDLFVEYPDNVTYKYDIVFKNIFVNTNQLEHYNMMMGIKTDLDE